VVSVGSSAEFVDVSAVAADEFVELVSGDSEFFGPVGDVGGHFGVDLFGVVRALGDRLFGHDMGGVGFGFVVVLRHKGASSFRFFLVR
jgi:hypothetical protein